MSSDGPLTRVLTAIEAGARQRTDIVAATSLDADVVDLAVDQLTRLGRLVAQPLTSGCPTGGCLGCPAPTGHGCGAPTGPVLVARRLARR